MRTDSRKNKKNIILITSGIVVLAIGLGALAYAKDWWPFQNAQVSDTNLSEEEKAQKNASDPTYTSEKTNPNNEIEPETSKDNSSKLSVQVGIASASKQDDNFEVRAFVSGTIEGDGTCTATLIKDDETVTGTSVAFIDASTTQCEPIEIQQSKLSSGTWQLTVRYESVTHEGVSSAMKVTI